MRGSNGREKWVNLGFENERARTLGREEGGEGDVGAGGGEGRGGRLAGQPQPRLEEPADRSAAANGKAGWCGGGPGRREAPPPRVRRAGAEPGPRQVVPGVRTAQGAGRGAER